MGGEHGTYRDKPKVMNKFVKIVTVAYFFTAAVCENRGAFDSRTLTITNTVEASYSLENEPMQDVCGLKVVVCQNEAAPTVETKNEVEKIICDVFGKDCKMAIAIAKAESGLNPKAVNSRNTNGTSDYGLFQINSIHKPTEAQKFDPRENAKVAKRLYEARGNWTAWSAYNNGAYKKFMK